jgi:hypothetical protein
MSASRPKLGFLGWALSGGAYFGQVPGANLGSIGTALIGAGAVPAFRGMQAGNPNSPMLFIVCLAAGCGFLAGGYSQYCSACDAETHDGETRLKDSLAGLAGSYAPASKTACDQCGKSFPSGFYLQKCEDGRYLCEACRMLAVEDAKEETPSQALALEQETDAAELVRSPSQPALDATDREAEATSHSAVLKGDNPPGRVYEKRSPLKIAAGITGCVLLVCLIALGFVNVPRSEDLTTKVDGQVRRLLPALRSTSGSPETTPISKYAVWWIGENATAAGGDGKNQPTGTLQSSSGGGLLGILTPRFEELDAIVIVERTFGESQDYLALPKDMRPFEIGFNPFGGAPSQYIDRQGRIHNAEEFKKHLTTYGLHAWVTGPTSNRVVAYREFAAEHLLAQYDSPPSIEEVPQKALDSWIQSCRAMNKPTAGGTSTKPTSTKGKSVPPINTARIVVEPVRAKSGVVPLPFRVLTKPMINLSSERLMALSHSPERRLLDKFRVDDSRGRRECQDPTETTQQGNSDL